MRSCEGSDPRLLQSGANKIVLILPQENTWQVRAITSISGT